MPYNVELSGRAMSHDGATAALAKPMRGSLRLAPHRNRPARTRCYASRCCCRLANRSKEPQPPLLPPDDAGYHGRSATTAAARSLTKCSARAQHDLSDTALRSGPSPTIKELARTPRWLLTATLRCAPRGGNAHGYDEPARAEGTARRLCNARHSSSR